MLRALFGGFITWCLSVSGQSCTPSEAHIETFHSEILNRTQKVRILLPPGYGSSLQEPLPVLFLFDGQYVLPDCQENAWLPVQQVVLKLIRERKIKPMIVVGIDSGVSRSHEYWPYPSLFELPNEEPIGRSMPDLLIEVISNLRAYRITSNPALTGVGGVSNGALAALYAVLTHPERFGLVLLESPPLYDGNGQLLKDASNLARGPDRISIGIGTNEIKLPEAKQFVDHFRVSEDEANRGLVELVRRLAKNFQTSAFHKPKTRIVIQRGGTHEPESWNKRFPGALKFLFGTEH